MKDEWWDNHVGMGRDKTTRTSRAKGTERGVIRLIQEVWYLLERRGKGSEESMCD